MTSAARWRAVILVLWAVSIWCVIVGSLAPAESSLMVAIGRLHMWDKLQHFSAYLALSFLPVIGFKDRRRGLMAGLSMFLLGVLMEAGQHFSPGRSVELGDVVANGVGVSCGILLGRIGGRGRRRARAALARPRARAQEAGGHGVATRPPAHLAATARSEPTSRGGDTEPGEMARHS